MYLESYTTQTFAWPILFSYWYVSNTLKTILLSLHHHLHSWLVSMAMSEDLLGCLHQALTWIPRHSSPKQKCAKQLTMSGMHLLCNTLQKHVLYIGLAYNIHPNLMAFSDTPQCYNFDVRLFQGHSSAKPTTSTRTSCIPWDVKCGRKCLVVSKTSQPFSCFVLRKKRKHVLQEHADSRLCDFGENNCICSGHGWWGPASWPWTCFLHLGTSQKDYDYIIITDDSIWLLTYDQYSFI